MLEKIITYRVQAESKCFAPEDYETLAAALNRANERNALRLITGEKDKFYAGDNCKVFKVTTIVEPLTR